MLDPLSIGLALLLSTAKDALQSEAAKAAFSGIIGNRADHLLTSGLRKIKDIISLRSSNYPENHDLLRALRLSMLNATEMLYLTMDEDGENKQFRKKLKKWNDEQIKLLPKLSKWSDWDNPASGELELFFINKDEHGDKKDVLIDKMISSWEKYIQSQLNVELPQVFISKLRDGWIADNKRIYWHEATMVLMIEALRNPKDGQSIKAARAFEHNFLSEIKLQLSDIHKLLLSQFANNDTILENIELIKGQTAIIKDVKEDTSNILSKLNKVLDLTVPIPKRLNQIQIRAIKDIIGRKNDLENLRKLLKEKSSILLMNGMGGIGKTTLVEVYIHEYEKFYNHIMWVNSSSDVRQALLFDYLLHDNLKIGDEIRKFKEANKVDEAWALLINSLQKLNGNCLFIADNINSSVEDRFIKTFNVVEDLQNVLPQFHFLITSRELFEDIQIYELGFLSLQEAIETFYLYYDKGNMRPRNDNFVKEIVEIAGLNTLTIETLAKTLRASKNHTYQTFLDELKKKGFELTKNESIYSRYNKKEDYIYAILEFAFELSSIESDDEALNLLRGFSIFPSQSNSLEQLTDVFNSNIVSSPNLVSKLNLLTERGWLIENFSVEMGNDSCKYYYRCHEVIQYVLRKKLLPNSKNCYKEIYNLSSIAVKLNENNSLKGEQWLPYFENVLNYLMADEENIATLMTEFSLFYRAIGQFEKALSIQESSLAIRLRILELDPLQNKTFFINLGASYGNIGLFLLDNGKYVESIINLKKGLQILVPLIGEANSSIANIYHNLSLIYSGTGEFELSIESSKKSVEIKLKFMQENDPSILHTYNNIAFAFIRLNKSNEALDYINKAIDIGINVLPSNHYYFILFYNTASVIYYNLGDYSQALFFAEKAMNIAEEILPANHAQLALAYLNMGTSLGGDSNSYTEAITFTLKALKIQKDTLRENHPDLAITHNNLGNYFGILEDYEKALEHIIKAVKIFKETYPNGNSYLTNAAKMAAVILVKLIEAGMKDKYQAEINWFVSEYYQYIKD